MDAAAVLADSAGAIGVLAHVAVRHGLALAVNDVALVADLVVAVSTARAVAASVDAPTWGLQKMCVSRVATFVCVCGGVVSVCVCVCVCV